MWQLVQGGRRTHRSPLCVGHPRKGMASTIMAWVACIAVTSGPLSAQIRGTVVTGHALPIPEVTVDLWRAGRRLDGTSTGPGGRFHLPLPGTFPVHLTFRQIGYRPQVVRVDSTTRMPLTIELGRAPIELERIDVTAGAARCPHPDLPVARAAVRDALSHYAAIEPGASIRAALFQGVARRRSPQTAWMAAGEMIEGEIGFTSAFLHQESEKRRRHGTPGPDADESGELAAGIASFWGVEDSPQLLAEPAFLEGHSFILLSRDDQGTVVGFCARDRNKPYIDGAISIDQRGRLTQVIWRFGRNGEWRQAGGEVLIAPPDGNTASRYLLPMAARSWWRAESGEFLERTRLYKEWSVVRP